MEVPPDRPPSRTRLDEADLRAAWEQHAAEWIEWARRPDHDSYSWHRDLFLELVPTAGRTTLDLGCGEGRLSRDLARIGHRMTGVDASPTLVDAARQAEPSIPVEHADAAALPFPDEAFDCVVAFMSLQDVEDLDGVVAECARVLEPGGRLVTAIVHPLSSAGGFLSRDSDAPFVIDGSYLANSYYADSVARDGIEMSFVSVHRPLERYVQALAATGFLVERLREVAVPEEAIAHERTHRWRRIPIFLHLVALKPEQGV